MIEASARTLKSACGSFGNRRLKYLRNTLIVLALLVTLVAALLWFLPARWALPWIEPQLHGVRLQQVHGSVWDGEAGDVIAVDGQRLGPLQWQVSRRALLGDMHLHVVFEGLQLTYSGSTRHLPDGRIESDGLHLNVALDGRATYARTPLGQPLGELQLDVEHFLLQGGWPVELKAHGLWQHAAVRTDDGEIPLGDMQVEAQSQGGAIQAQWHDVGAGPLQVQGQLQLSPLGWRLDTVLRARQPDPALQHWLTQVGPVAQDGSVHIQQSGGLASTSPLIDKGVVQP